MAASQPDESIAWEAPPPMKGRKASKWEPIANALKANPGKWARIVTQGNVGIKASAEKGELRCFKPAGSFEGRTINFTDRFIGDVYLRYIGEHGEFKDIQ